MGEEGAVQVIRMTQMEEVVEMIDVDGGMDGDDVTIVIVVTDGEMDDAVDVGIGLTGPVVVHLLHHLHQTLRAHVTVDGDKFCLQSLHKLNSAWLTRVYQSLMETLTSILFGGHK